jgi:hypothetical protein
MAGTETYATDSSKESPDFKDVRRITSVFVNGVAEISTSIQPLREGTGSPFLVFQWPCPSAKNSRRAADSSNTSNITSRVFQARSHWILYLARNGVSSASPITTPSANMSSLRYASVRYSSPTPSAGAHITTRPRLALTLVSWPGDWVSGRLDIAADANGKLNPLRNSRRQLHISRLEVEPQYWRQKYGNGRRRSFSHSFFGSGVLFVFVVLEGRLSFCSRRHRGLDAGRDGAAR